MSKSGHFSRIPLTGKHPQGVHQSIYNNLSSKACQYSHGSCYGKLDKLDAEARSILLGTTVPFERLLSGVVPGHPGLRRNRGERQFFGHVVPAALRTEFGKLTIEAAPGQYFLQALHGR